MFKINDCFKSCNIFNGLLVKRFEENFNARDSQLWMSPGHIAYLNKDGTKLHTCDARPYDFNTSPSEPESDELFTAASKVLEVYFDTESASTRMFVVFSNGDVQIFEYRIQLYEWARIGYFNVNIVSPNTNNSLIHMTQALISHYQNMIFWSQKSGTNDATMDLYKREIPLNGVREITQSAIGVPQKLLKNCPSIDLVEIRENICIFPHLPNFVNLYIIISARLHVWLFHIDGKLLWRGIIGDSPLDFMTLCAKSVGLWTPTGFVKVCKLLNEKKSHAYFCNNDKIVCITHNGEIYTKIPVGVTVEDVQECYVMGNVICLFKRNFESLQIHSIYDGNLLQKFNLDDYFPIYRSWCHISCVPSLGFYSNQEIYKLNYKNLSTLLSSEPPCNLRSLSILKNENFHVFSLLRDVIHHEFNQCDIPPLKSLPKVLQSEALLLAVLQSCREKGYRSNEFPTKHLNELFMKNQMPETKLHELLDPIVESFQKLEEYNNVIKVTTSST